jgi:serine O-acetyltransferase
VAHLEEGEVGLVESIKADYAAFKAFYSVLGKSRLRSLFNILTWPMFHAVVIFRLARAAQRNGLAPIARVLMYINEVVFFVEFSPKAIIGPGLLLVHAGSGCSAGTRIGRNCIILMFVQLGVAGYADPSRDGPPVVGDDVVLSGGCSIYGPVTIGSRSVIGAGVRLFESVPEDSRVTARQPLTIKSIKRRSTHLEPSTDVEASTESPGVA